MYIFSVFFFNSIILLSKVILQNAEYTWNHLQKQILKNFTSPVAYINEPPVEYIPKDTLYMGARPRESTTP